MQYRCVFLRAQGFSLVEATASMAIMATVAAIAIPIAIDIIDTTKTNSQNVTINTISAAIQALAGDVGNGKIGKSRGPGKKTFLILEGPGNRPKDSTGTVDYFQSGSGIDWNSVSTTGVTLADLSPLSNHLSVNDPDGDGILGEPNNDYVPAKWGGPYLTHIPTDPFGNAFLVLVQGIRDGEQAGGGENVFGWIISAGPNGRLETDDASSVLGGDDIGEMITEIDKDDEDD